MNRIFISGAIQQGMSWISSSIWAIGSYRLRSNPVIPSPRIFLRDWIFGKPCPTILPRRRHWYMLATDLFIRKTQLSIPGGTFKKISEHGILPLITILCLPKIDRVLCPEIVIATRSGTPALIIFLTTVLLKKLWNVEPLKAINFRHFFCHNFAINGYVYG